MSFPADSSFDVPASWTVDSSCGLLCNASGSVAGTAGNPGGSAVAQYSSIAGVLGVLGTGTGSVTHTSGAFSWNADTPASVSLNFQRKATTSTLISVGGSVQSTVSLLDLTAGTTGVLDTAAATASGWTTYSVNVPAAALKSGHSYKLRITTAFNAAVQVLGGASVSYDNLTLDATPTASAVGTATYNPTQTTANAAASVTTGGLAGSYLVQYGTTTSYGSATTPVSFPAQSTPVTASTSLTGLTANTTYHARFAITTSAGTTYGPDQTFTTLAIGAVHTPTPIIGSVTATTSTPTGWTSRPSSIPTVRPARCTTSSMGPAASARPTRPRPHTITPLLSGSIAAAASTLTGLSAQTLYHARLVVVAGGQTFHGPDTSFTTDVLRLPVVSTSSRTSVTACLHRVGDHGHGLAHHVVGGLR